MTNWAWARKSCAIRGERSKDYVRELHFKGNQDTSLSQDESINSTALSWKKSNENLEYSVEFWLYLYQAYRPLKKASYVKRIAIPPYYYSHGVNILRLAPHYTLFRTFQLYSPISDSNDTLCRVRLKYPRTSKHQDLLIYYAPRTRVGWLLHNGPKRGLIWQPSNWYLWYSIPRFL